jgi:hypothetical protein
MNTLFIMAAQQSDPVPAGPITTEEIKDLFRDLVRIPEGTPTAVFAAAAVRMVLDQYFHEIDKHYNLHCQPWCGRRTMLKTNAVMLATTSPDSERASELLRESCENLDRFDVLLNNPPAEIEDTD